MTGLRSHNYLSIGASHRIGHQWGIEWEFSDLNLGGPFYSTLVLGRPGSSRVIVLYKTITYVTGTDAWPRAIPALYALCLVDAANQTAQVVEVREPGPDWQQTCREMKNAAEDLAKKRLGIVPVAREIQTYGITTKIGLQYGL